MKQVEQLPQAQKQQKLLNMLGLARRAGRVSLGSDPSIEALRKGQSYLILFASDLSPRTAGGVRNAAEETGVPWCKTGATMDEISMALGKRTGVIAINDAGFAKTLSSLCADD